MAVTYEPIATTTLGSAQLSVTFSSIPSTYTDIFIAVGGFMETASDDQTIDYQVNSDTGTNYSSTYVYGLSSSTGSGRDTSSTYGVCGRFGGTNYGGTMLIHFMNYANTTTYKTVLSRGSTTFLTIATASLWRSTSAINTIKIFPANNKFASGTVFTLYGIKSA